MPRGGGDMQVRCGGRGEGPAGGGASGMRMGEARLDWDGGN